MKRTPLARRSPMSRASKPLERHTRMKPRNEARRRRDWPTQYHSVERVLWVKSLPCRTCENRGGLPIHNSHVRTRRTHDYTHVIPQCVRCHREMDAINSGVETFCRSRGITVQDLETYAAETQAAWLVIEAATTKET